MINISLLFNIKKFKVPLKINLLNELFSYNKILNPCEN